MAKKIVSTTTPVPVTRENPVFFVGSYSMKVTYSDDSANGIQFDCLERRKGSKDSVALLIHRMRPAGQEILMRKVLRPVAGLREGAEAVIWELPAGSLEPCDAENAAGACVRASAELREETGFIRDPESFNILGFPSYTSPGCSPERMWFATVEIDGQEKPGSIEGDGSFMEEGCWNEWVDLQELMQMTARGEIRDLKTEVGLSRVFAYLIARV